MGCEGLGRGLISGSSSRARVWVLLAARLHEGIVRDEGIRGELDQCDHQLLRRVRLEELLVDDTHLRGRLDDAAALSGGYRDVQLAAVLDTPETRARGAHEHLFELQLHLRAFAALKSEGGHKAYVQCRNLKGQ